MPTNTNQRVATMDDALALVSKPALDRCPEKARLARDRITLISPTVYDARCEIEDVQAGGFDLVAARRADLDRAYARAEQTQELRAELAADPNLTDGERQAYLDNALDAEWAAFSQVQA